MTALIPGPPVRAPVLVHTPPVPGLTAEVRLVPRAEWGRITPLLAAGNVAACYLLLDSWTHERGIRVGETQDISQRLTRHSADPRMNWADVAVIVSGRCVDKTMAEGLQQALEFHLRDRACVTLKALATAHTPKMCQAEWKRVNRFKYNIIATLQRLGIVLNPDGAHGRYDDARLVETIFDVADIEEAFLFGDRDLEAAIARFGGNLYLLAGSEIRVVAAECALPKHKRLREQLLALGRVSESFAPRRVRIGCPIRVYSLDSAGKAVVGDRHRYGHSWLPCEPASLPRACLDRLAGDLSGAPQGGQP